MERENSETFGVFDYCLFAGVLIISGGIGLYTFYKGNKSPEEFLMGNRSFKPLPIAISLLTSYVSAINILGHPAEVYAYGIQIYTMTIGNMSGILFSYYFFLPMLFPLKLTSIIEYIELRFKSKRLSLSILLLTIMKTALACGIILYAPTIALASITKLNILANIFLLGTICTIYSAFGGIRAVVWTDVFQFSAMLIGLIAIVGVGIVENEGIVNILYTSSKGERLELFNMSPSPFERYTFINTFTFGFFIYSQIYSNEQINLQRICAVKSIKNARRVLSYNIFGSLLLTSLLHFCGLVVYASYAGCDPMALGIIKRNAEIIPYFVIDKLSFIPGLTGIFIAAIIGGSLSTLSSAINACTALIWKDVCLNFKHFQTASSSYATLVNKIISMVVGSAFTAAAIITSNAGSLIEIAITVTATLSGPIYGVYLIGLFLPRCNIKGVWTGFLLFSVMMIWIVLGGLFYKEPPKMLPFSTEECDHSNFTSLNSSKLQDFLSFINGSMENTNETT
ncbi:UNVERIFIED_CONTAM: hypothetical protein RMT77_006538 [Armadillidium vulgare]